MMALTYLPNLRVPSDRRPDSPAPERQRLKRNTPNRSPQNSPTHCPTSEELQRFVGCKVGEAIAQMKVWGYHRVTLNVPENKMSVATRRGRIEFQFLSRDAIVNRIEWEGSTTDEPRECKLAPKRS